MRGRIFRLAAAAGASIIALSTDRHRDGRGLRNGKATGAMTRIGLFGGTFDPIHTGHLLLAETAREALRLGRVVFIPAAQPPHKTGVRISPAAHRLDMVRIAIADNPAFEASDVELKRTGPSYSVDTVAHFHDNLEEGDELFFLVGSDSVAELPTWYEPRRLAELATVAAVARPGHPLRDLSGLAPTLGAGQIDSLRRHAIEMPQMDLASRDMRRRIAGGLSVRYMTPWAVIEYIRTHGLYC
jgi:nicotinate-nucleotide adenylyltransferase